MTLNRKLPLAGAGRAGMPAGDAPVHQPPQAPPEESARGAQLREPVAADESAGRGEPADVPEVTPTALAGPVRRLALLGVGTELLAMHRLEEHLTDLGIDEPVRTGTAGGRLRLARTLAIGGGLGTLLAGRSRILAVAAGAAPQQARKWWTGEIARLANKAGEPFVEFAAQRHVTPKTIAELDGLVKSGRLNDSMARQTLEGVLAGEGTPTEVADARGLELVQDDGALEAAVAKVIDANPDVAQKVRDGKVQAAGALIGQVMKAMKGQADAKRVRELILEKLS